MAITKTARTVQTSTSVAAGGNQTSGAFDLTTKYGGVLHLKVTNGATGPTVGCTAKVEISNDNSAWKTYRRFKAGVANSGVYEWALDIPPGVMYLRTDFRDHTGQAVTVEATFHEVTSL